MSMTPEAYDEKKWRGLKNLRSALSGAKLSDHHFGYRSDHYNKFESLSDLLRISLLVIEKMDDIPYSGGCNTIEEMMLLAAELQHTAAELTELGSRLKNEADRWAERSWRALND